MRASVDIWKRPETSKEENLHYTGLINWSTSEHDTVRKTLEVQIAVVCLKGAPER